jgi:hypothetical protein
MARRQAPLTLRRWNRVEYDRLVELGAFDNDPIELIGGHLVVAEPKGTYHTSAGSAAEYALRAALPLGWIVRRRRPSRSTTSRSRSRISPSWPAGPPT